MKPTRSAMQAAHAVLAITALVAMQAQAQTSTQRYTSPPGSGYYDALVLYNPYTAPPPVTATLAWNRTTTSFFRLGKVTGTYRDREVTGTETWTHGKTVTFKQPVLDLDPVMVSFTGTPFSRRPSGAAFSDTVTWEMLDADYNAGLGFGGGTFSLSGMKLEPLTDGSYRIVGTVSGLSLAGTRVAPTEITAFTVAASQVSASGEATTWGQLVMTTAMLEHLSTALGQIPGVEQTPIFQATSMGSLRIAVQVPEAGTWAMWALGLTGMVVTRGLRRRQQA